MKTSSASLLVKIERREDGAILSSLRFPSPADQETLLSWPTGGMHQSGTALLIEGLRREALLQILVHMSKGREPEALTPQELEEGVRLQALHLMEEALRGIVEEELRKTRQ